MKKILFTLILAATTYCNAQIRTVPHEWTAVLTVVDETGQPVQGAEVSIAFSVASPQGTPIDQQIKGITDTNGVFQASHTDLSVELAFSAKKTGYYSFWIQYFLGFSVDKKDVDWDPKPTLVLKRIREPIPMYAKSVTDAAPPADGQAVGYDLTAGDWVAPHGKGQTTDFLFLKRFDKRSRKDYDYQLTVSFPNKGDGIQGFDFPHPTSQGSALRSAHEAPEIGYEPEVIKSQSARPGQFVNPIWNEKTNYYFRVRTVLDEKGNIKSALYGKIYGDLNQFRYYLNPKPNDRNVEFDPKQNLLHGLKPFEEVNAP